MRRFLRTTLNPDRYHGRKDQKPPFFEGWYYKLVDASEQNRYAVIPGIFLGSAPHAFIQVLDGATAKACYHTYSADAFWAADDRFEVRIGDNRFTSDSISLHIDAPDFPVAGELSFAGRNPWPVTIVSPGVMGWYAWMPFMECYHGVVSLDHEIMGGLRVDGRSVDFSGGRGYTEKDWGRSFPEAWIWMQTNHFDRPGVCLTGSIAIIPWGRRAFRGFIVGLWLEQRLYRFATYTGAGTIELAVDDDMIHWVMEDKQHRLAITARRGSESRFGLLKGPDTVEMGKRVAETLTAVVEVRLSSLVAGGERPIFSGRGRHAGLEVHNVQERLLNMV